MVLTDKEIINMSCLVLGAGSWVLGPWCWVLCLYRWRGFVIRAFYSVVIVPFACLQFILFCYGTDYKSAPARNQRQQGRSSHKLTIILRETQPAICRSRLPGSGYFQTVSPPLHLQPEIPTFCIFQRRASGFPYPSMILCVPG